EAVKLGPNAEEVASFYAAVQGTDWSDNKVFQENFFRDFRKVLLREDSKMSFIDDFQKCDFSLIYEYLQIKKEEKKNMTKDEKQKLKDEKSRLDEIYSWAYLDGKKEKVGNYRIEPPGLFKGRGSHPKTGSLKKHIGRVRSDYSKELKDKVMATRQRATAMYLIDRFALRAGNEKGEDEADTVGCCSLRFEHISLEPPNVVEFDFLGKDSIRYYNRVEVDEQVFKNLQIFKKEPKKNGDLLFDRLSTTLLNKHLSTYMDGLTAKVFRTFNASYTFQEELSKTPTTGTLKRLKCERLGLKKELLEADATQGKLRPDFKEGDESDVDDAFIQKYEAECLLKEKEKEAKLLLKENEKRSFNGEAPLDKLPPRKKLAMSGDRLLKKIHDLNSRIQSTKLLIIDKDENKSTALGTSKINYIDPRISVAWCQKHDVKLSEIFNKSLQEKFKWAFDVDKTWSF
ncbi:DNA topoisomerase 1, partial [Dinochytrium kinnereticum]